MLAERIPNPLSRRASPAASSGLPRRSRHGDSSSACRPSSRTVVGRASGWLAVVEEDPQVAQQGDGQRGVDGRGLGHEMGAGLAGSGGPLRADRLGDAQQRFPDVGWSIDHTVGEQRLIDRT